MGLMDGFKFWLGKALAELGITLLVIVVIVVVLAVQSLLAGRSRK